MKYLTLLIILSFQGCINLDAPARWRSDAWQHKRVSDSLSKETKKNLKVNTLRYSIIDSFIARHDTVDFSEFSGLVLTRRLSGSLSTTYSVGFVNHKYNDIGMVASNDNGALRIHSKADGGTDTSFLYRKLRTFQHLNFSKLMVDHAKNVYINPFNNDTGIIIIRIKDSADSEINVDGAFYEQYNGRWYIRKGFIP